MKARRLTCTLFAACMLVASALPAGAANMTENANLSEYAGSTVKCQIIKSSDTGEPVSSTIDIAIPEGATKAQEDAAIQAAVFKEEGVAMTRATRNVMDLISTEKDLTITSTGYTHVGTGTIPGPDNIMLIVQFEGYANFGASKMSVTVTGGKTPTNSYTMTSDIDAASTITLWMYTGSGNVFLTNGSTVTAKAKTDTSKVIADSCSMWVTVHDMG